VSRSTEAFTLNQESIEAFTNRRYKEATEKSLAAVEAHAKEFPDDPVNVTLLSNAMYAMCKMDCDPAALLAFAEHVRTLAEAKGDADSLSKAQQVLTECKRRLERKT